MAHSVVISSASFTNYVDRAVPYLSLAKGFYLFGTDFNSSKVNLAPAASVNLTSNGAPTYGTGYAQMAYPNDFFSSGITPSQDQTVLVVATRSAGGDYYAKNAAGSLLLGMSAAGATTARFSSSLGPTCIGTFDPGTAFGFLAGATPGTTGQPFKMYAGGNDALTLTSNGTLGANLAASEIILGPSGQFSGGVGHKVAAAMIFDTELTQPQLLEIYSYFRFALPKRGITIA